MLADGGDEALLEPLLEATSRGKHLALEAEAAAPPPPLAAKPKARPLEGDNANPVLCAYMFSATGAASCGCALAPRMQWLN